MNDFVLYGQWVVVVISLLGVALVSSTKHNTRLSGYIVTALGRLSGAVLFIFLDLYAFSHSLILAIDEPTSRNTSNLKPITLERV